MKIVIATPLYPPDIGRPSEYVKELAARAASRFAITVMTYGSLPEWIAGVHVVAVSKGWPIPFRLAAFTFRLWREARRADALWVCDGASVGLPSVLVGALRGVPIIRFVLMDEAADRAKQDQRTSGEERVRGAMRSAGLKLVLFRMLQDFVLKCATRVVVPTGALRDSSAAFADPSRVIISSYPAERLQTVPFPVEYRPSRVIAIGSSLSPEDIQTLLAAISKSVSSCPEIKLSVLGDVARMHEILDRAADYGIADRVECLGFVSRAEMSYLLRSSAVLVLGQSHPDLHEPVFLAYEAGIPLVAPDDGHQREVIKHGISGLLVVAGDSDVLADTMRRVMNDGGLRDSLTTGGRLALKENFGWDAHVESFRSIIEQTKKYGDDRR